MLLPVGMGFFLLLSGSRLTVDSFLWPFDFGLDLIVTETLFLSPSPFIFIYWERGGTSY